MVVALPIELLATEMPVRQLEYELDTSVIKRLLDRMAETKTPCSFSRAL